MEKISKVALKCIAIFANMIFADPALAKIGDCNPIIDGNIEYRSHADYVEASDNNGRLLWHTTLFNDGDKRGSNSSLEADVQLSTTCVVKVEGNNVIVEFGQARPFLINKKSGKVVGRIER